MSSLNTIYTLVCTSSARATKCWTGSAMFLIKDKRAIVEAIRDSEYSMNAVCDYLETKGENWDLWKGRIAHWTAAYNKGRLDTQDAVSVQRKVAPVCSSFEQQVLSLLENGETEEGIIVQVKAITRKFNTNSVLKEVEALLASKGLTIADLK